MFYLTKRYSCINKNGKLWREKTMNKENSEKGNILYSHEKNIWYLNLELTPVKGFSGILSLTLCSCEQPFFHFLDTATKRKPASEYLP